MMIEISFFLTSFSCSILELFNDSPKMTNEAFA